MSSYRFTVFTATYNRADTLPRVYKSLIAQTFRDFEWLIVDDGSSDGTGDLVRQWQAEADFPIRYFWQENEGKHVAWNHGVREAQGELFLSLDSDDACVPTSLERFDKHWSDIEASSAAGTFSAVTALSMNPDGSLIGTRYPRDVFDSNSIESRLRYKVAGEKWGFHKTSILRDYPFPKAADGSFVPEGVVWSAIARKYKTRYINEPLRFYWTGGDDSLSKTTRQNFDNKFGNVLLYRDALNHNLRYFRYSPLRLTGTAAYYVRFSFHSGISPLRQVADLKGLAPRALWLVSLPVGALMYANDRRRAGA